MEIKNSIVVKADKVKDKDGRHSFFPTENGNVYEFYIAFENGDTGKHKTMKENQVKFVIGQPAFYTRTLNEKSQFEEWLIKPANEQKNPKIKCTDTTKQTVHMGNLSLAIFAYKVFKKTATSTETLLALANKFNDWCYQVDDKQQIQIRKLALQMSITSMQDSLKTESAFIELSDFPFGIDGVVFKTSDDIIELATFFYNFSLINNDK